MDQDKFSLLKSHVEAYTRKDGAVVGAHDTKVQKHPQAIQSAIDTLAPGDDNWQHGDGHSSYPMRIGGRNHMNAMDSLGDNGWSVTGGEHDEMKHPDGHTATFKDGAMTLKHGSK